MTDEETRRACGRISDLLGLDYDESEQIQMSKLDLYDIIRWHSGGKRPRNGRGAYSRHGLERRVCDELGIDRRSSPTGFIADEYETMLTIIENRIEEQRQGVKTAKEGSLFETTFTPASELAGGTDDE